jgi:hypothetical protein
VTLEHFRLLRTFGRNEMQRRASDTQRNEFWRMVCQSTPGVPFVPHEEVVAAWKKFITGNAVDSGLALNGDIDPSYVSVGVTYKRKMVAAHTTRMKPLIKRLLSIYSKAFGTRAEFLDAMEALSKEVVEQGEKKQRRGEKK